MVKELLFKQIKNNSIKLLRNSEVTYICVTQKLHVMQKDIVQTWFFQHSPETVWMYLIDSKLLAQWLMENDFKPTVGHEFMFWTKPKVKVGFDGKVYCKVLEVIPEEKLSYSWRGGPGNGKITLDSVVTWTLTPKDGGTELLLEHTGFKGMRNYLSYFFMNKGWANNVRKRLLHLLTINENETSNI